MYCEKLWTCYKTDSIKYWCNKRRLALCSYYIFLSHSCILYTLVARSDSSWSGSVVMKSKIVSWSTPKLKDRSIFRNILHMSVPTFLVPKVQHATQQHDAVLMKYEPQSCLLSLPPPTVFSETYSSVLFSCNMMLFVTSWLPYCFHNRLLAKSVFMDPVRAFWCVEYHRPYYLFFHLVMWHQS